MRSRCMCKDSQNPMQNIMKHLFLFLITAIMFYGNIYAQYYQISFTGTGESSVVESVKIENLTQCTSIEINGDDVLHLVNVLGVNDYNQQKDKSLCIYPNPFDEICNIEFNTTVSGPVTLSLSDLNGKLIFQIQENIKQGKHYFMLSGLQKGIYVIEATTDRYSYSERILSNSDKNGNPEIVYLGIVNKDNINTLYEFNNKQNSAIVQMQYNTGDVIKFTGKSGIYRTVYMLVPTSNQIVNFNFIDCTDASGNHYAVVKIGNQWWMAENLTVGTYVPITSPQVAGTKFCMDINGQDDPTCPMGGLYEWENLLSGATPCNGTGAPPNDKCTTPAKGLCPNGWHIPSHYEWTTLARNSGSSPGSFPYDMSIGVLGVDEGGNLKETCTTDWWSPNAGATNKTGFSGIPGGDTWDGIFEDFGQSAYFWTSTWSYSSLPWVYALNYSLPSVGRSLYVRENGFSCRCVKD